jgi:hypothetical protein
LTNFLQKKEGVSDSFVVKVNNKYRDIIYNFSQQGQIDDMIKAFFMKYISDKAYGNDPEG